MTTADRIDTATCLFGPRLAHLNRRDVRLKCNCTCVSTYIVSCNPENMDVVGVI